MMLLTLRFRCLEFRRAGSGTRLYAQPAKGVGSFVGPGELTPWERADLPQIGLGWGVRSWGLVCFGRQASWTLCRMAVCMGAISTRPKWRHGGSALSRLSAASRACPLRSASVHWGTCTVTSQAAGREIRSGLCSAPELWSERTP